MGKKIIFISVVCMVLCPLFLRSQDFMNKLVTRNDVDFVLDKAVKYIDSVDSLFQARERLILYPIFEVRPLSEDIDSLEINDKEYFLSKKFLYDVIKLKYKDRLLEIEQKKYFFPGMILVYDTIGKLTGIMSGNYRRIDKILYQDYLNYLIDLLRTNQVDCIFMYPTVKGDPPDWKNRVSYSYVHGLFFALKGSDIYVLIMGKCEYINNELICKDKKMILLNDYIDCCWEAMTGIDKINQH